ncbi:MAG: hypothetical protein ACRDEA_02980 [Microcystaceae cyanobacterium]
MQERDLHSLLDILISAKLALSYISAKNWTEFLTDIQLQDSVIRRLEIIEKNLVVIGNILQNDLHYLSEKIDKFVLHSEAK